jgi:hypothetical protein
MKTTLLLGLVLFAVAPVQAQVFRPPSFGGRAAWHGAYYHDVGYRGGPWWGFGLYAPLVWSPYVYSYPAAPVVYADDAYGSSYAYARPNYQFEGTFWGALAGAIIGRNSGSLGHSAWRGAAYGAGVGLLLGTVAESNARANAAATVRAQPAAPAAASAPAAQPVTIINNYYNAPSTPMGVANGMFGRN